MRFQRSPLALLVLLLFATVVAADIEKCMTEARSGNARAIAVSKRVQMVIQENAGNVLFRTVDKDSREIVHENYIKK